MLTPILPDGMVPLVTLFHHIQYLTQNINNYEIIITSNTICCDDCMNTLLQQEAITSEADYMEFDLTGLQIPTEKFDEWKENIPY